MKVVLAMSGGVDSGCAGALLRRSGHEVVGLTMLIDGFPPPPAMDEGVRECCAKLGIEHHYIDVSEAFQKKVILPAANEYASGRTPNPCSLCNPAIKFGELLKFTRAMKADRLATGHYVRLGFRDGKAFLRRGADRAKDQSYFLALLGKDVFDRVLFPLGELTKPVVRAVAADWIAKGGIAVAVGGPSERPIGEEIGKGLDPRKYFNMMGETDMFALMHLLKSAAAAVANDSGMMHLTAVLGTPGVAVFGSTDYTSTGPILPSWKLVCTDQPCAPCFCRTCPKNDPLCMKKILPETVIGALELLHKGPIEVKK